LAPTCMSMAGLTLTVVAVIVVLATVCGTDAIRCYSCFGPSACGDPFDPNRSGVTECEGTYCEKLKGTANVLGNKVSMVQRSCNYGSTSGIKESCESGSFQEVSGTVCYCKTPLCNSAHIVKQRSGGVYALLATSAIVVLLAKLQD